MEQSKQSIKSLDQLSAQLLSLEPPYRGPPIREAVMSVREPLTRLEHEVLAVVQSTVSHRLRFSQERVAATTLWLTGAEKLLEEVQSGLYRISKDSKQV